MAVGEYLKDLADRAASAAGLKDPDPERKCREFADKLYQMASSTLAPLHRSWYEAVLWVLGEHYLEYNTTTRRFVVRPERSHVPRAISNLILDLAERSVSFLVKSNVTGRVSPESVSAEASRRALNAERIRQRIWKDDRMDLKLRIADAWCVYTGNGMFLTGLDAANKPVVEIPEMRRVGVVDPDTGIPMVDPESGEPITTEEPTGGVEKLVPLTEVSSDPINPMEIVPDPHAKNPWEIRYWLHHRAEDIDVLADEFGSDVTKLVKPDQDLSTSHYYQHKLTDLVTRASQAGHTYGLSSAVQDVRMENSVVVRTFYRLPCANYPEGEVLVRAGGVTLRYEKYPFFSVRGQAYRNLHWYRWSIAPGCPWGFGLVRNLVDPQKRRNGMLTQAALSRKTMGNPQWLVPKGCEFSEEGTSRPGKVNLWRPKTQLRGAQPQQLDPKGMSPDFWRELDQTTADLDRISGMNDILRGENPPGVDAGVSLEFLAERASGRFEPTIKEMRETVKEMEEFRLMLVRHSAAWASGKKMLVRDEDGVAEMVELTNLDAPEDPMIEMEASTTVLWTQAAKKRNVSEMVAAGLVDSTLPQNRRKLLELFNASEYDDALGADIRLAEHENQVMLQGQAVPTRPFENPEIHLPVHRRLTLRPDYPSWPEPVRMAIEAHIALTLDGVSKLARDREEVSAPTPEETAGLAPPGGAPPKSSQPAEEVTA